jgi:hypothetical protein
MLGSGASSPLEEDVPKNERLTSCWLIAESALHYSSTYSKRVDLALHATAWANRSCSVVSRCVRLSVPLAALLAAAWILP